MAVTKPIDSVNFRGDDLRTQLRTVHRAMRDHFTAINDQLLRTQPKRFERPQKRFMVVIKTTAEPPKCRIALRNCVKFGSARLSANVELGRMAFPAVGSWADRW